MNTVKIITINKTTHENLNISDWNWITWLNNHAGVATWIVLIFAATTFVIAIRALIAWKKQKEYEMLIENLSHLNQAKEYIIKLRLLFSLPFEYDGDTVDEFDKIDTEKSP